MNLIQALQNWAGLQGIGKKPRTQKYHQEIIGIIRGRWPGGPDVDVDAITDQNITDFVLTVAHFSASRYNAILTALEAGHTEEMLFRNYRELVTADQAREFWSIVPRS